MVNATEALRAITHERNIFKSLIKSNEKVVAQSDERTSTETVDLLRHALAPRLNVAPISVDEKLFTTLAKKSKTVHLPDTEGGDNGDFNFTVVPSTPEANVLSSTFSFVGGHLAHKEINTKDGIETDITVENSGKPSKTERIIERTKADGHLQSEDVWEYVELKNGQFAYMRISKKYDATTDRATSLPSETMVIIIPEATIKSGQFSGEDLYLPRPDFLSKVIEFKARNQSVLLTEDALKNPLSENNRQTSIPLKVDTDR